MGSVRVKISGLNLPRLIERLIDKNVMVNDVVTKGRSVKFTINENDIDVLNKVCKIEHKYYVVISNSGLKNVLNKMPYLLGAMLAIVISFLYIYSFDKFVVDVSVVAESEMSFDLGEVNQKLKERGVVSGMLKKNVNISEIQKMLLLNFDDISGCTAKLDGGNLLIKIFPATKKYETNYDDLFSKYNAVITKAEAHSGKLKVKVGDVVQKGDLLIKNENGASGLVEGKVYFVGTVVYNENQQYAEKTGKTYKTKNINFCNLFIVKGKNRCTFSNYLVEKCDFYISPNYLFPIKVEEFIYYEVEMKERIVPFEKVETNMTTSAYNEALKNVPNKDKITNVTYSEVKDGPYTRVDCFIETVINIL